MWLDQGLSISETLLKCVDWAERHGHMDKYNRWYYVTPEDIRLIKKTSNALSFPDAKDCISVDKLITSELQEHICYYQPLSENQPLIIVVQTPWQKDILREHPHTMVFMDATYKAMTSYGLHFMLFFWPKVLEEQSHLLTLLLVRNQRTYLLSAWKSLQITTLDFFPGKKLKT